MTAQAHNRFVSLCRGRGVCCKRKPGLKPGFHKANFDHDNDQFSIKTKRLEGRMTAQPRNRFVSCVVVVEFAVNGNQALGGEQNLHYSNA